MYSTLLPPAQCGFLTGKSGSNISLGFFVSLIPSTPCVLSLTVKQQTPNLPDVCSNHTGRAKCRNTQVVKEAELQIQYSSVQIRFPTPLTTQKPAPLKLFLTKILT